MLFTGNRKMALQWKDLLNQIFITILLSILHYFLLYPFLINQIPQFLSSQTPLVFIYHCSLLFALNRALRQVRKLLGFGQKRWVSPIHAYSGFKFDQQKLKAIEESKQQKNVIKTQRFFVEQLIRDFFVFCLLLISFYPALMQTKISHKKQQFSIQNILSPQTNACCCLFLVGLYLRILFSHFLWDRQVLSSRIVDNFLIPFHHGLFLAMAANHILI